MNKELFYKLVDQYKAAPPEFQATQYWQKYEASIFKEIESLDIQYLRSGKYPVFKTFGFNEVVYPGSPLNVSMKKLAFKVLMKLIGNVTPYSLTIHDIRRMAYRHCELYGRLTNSIGIENIETSSIGSPEDLFELNKRKYSIWFLNYYLRYCFVNQHYPFRGDEVIVELGSGSGHQVEVLKKLYPGLTILCFDLPAQIFLAENYLANVFCRDQIVSIEECRDWRSLKDVRKGKIHFLGNWQFPILKDFKFDLFWNAASFGEMEPEVVKNYLSFIIGNFSHVYLLQARHGKEQAGENRVHRPTSFGDYDSFLSGYGLIADQDVYQANRRLSASGGYFEAVWKTKSQN